MPKKSFTNFLCSIFIVVVMNSCASKSILINHKPGSTLQLQEINKSNYQKLNGTYFNNPDTLNSSLWESLILKSKRKDKGINNNPNRVVKIEFKNHKSVSLSLFLEGRLIQEKICKGRFENNLFLLKKQIHGMGIIPLMWLYREQSTAIGINKNQDLVVAYDVSGAFLLGFFPLMGPPAPGYWDPNIFKRIN